MHPTFPFYNPWSFDRRCGRGLSPVKATGVASSLVADQTKELKVDTGISQ
jgi:hypothetical protein